MRRMIGRVCRRVRYQRALSRLESDVLDSGYNLTAEKSRHLAELARVEAGYPPASG